MGEDIKDRIRLIMEKEDLTSSAFADKLGVGRANISHILSGRNNASLEVVTKILEAFTNINPSWLLSGKGGMLNNDEKIGLEDTSRQNITYRDLFSDESEWTEEHSKTTAPSHTGHITKDEDNLLPPQPTSIPSTIVKEVKTKQVAKIIVYYDDNSYQIFNPSSEFF